MSGIHGPLCQGVVHTHQASLKRHQSPLCRIIENNNRAGSQRHLAITISPTLMTASTYTLRQSETGTFSVWSAHTV